MTALKGVLGSGAGLGAGARVGVYIPVLIKQVVEWAQRLKGKPYAFGTEQDGRQNPTAEDCSELVQNACDVNKVRPRMPDGAINQFYHCRAQDTLISVEDAEATYGALVFRITPPHNHVVFSLGNGLTFEARGRAYGVGSWSIADREWTHAALIPGVNYEEKEV